MLTGARNAADRGESLRLRLTFLLLLVVGLFVLILARLWFLQIMAGEQFVAQATGNAVRTVDLEAPRGMILDREGETLVRNRWSPMVAVLPDDIGGEDERERIYGELADVLDMEPEVVAQRAESLRWGPFQPRPVATDVDRDVISYIHERSGTDWPGVHTQTRPVREYPRGETAAHLPGSVNEISAEQLEMDRYDGYAPGQMIGARGLERAYEDLLRGTRGQRRLEVDPAGNVVRELGQTDPAPGADLQLTLDLDDQQIAEDALDEGLDLAREAGLPATSGAVVVLDPNDGAVRALASAPRFDAGLFSGGISQDDLEAIEDPDNEAPRRNRALEEVYAPGSVFKPVTSLAALREGLITPQTTIDCPPEWELGDRTFPNWTSEPQGQLDLEQALARSCNTFYYELGYTFWRSESNELSAQDGGVLDILRRGDGPDEALVETGKDLGLTQRTGLLPAEAAGSVPGREWKLEYWEATRERTCAQAQEAQEVGSPNADLLRELCEEGWRWRGGDAVNASIGQGDVSVTPLQMANLYAAIANRGTVWEPYLVASAEMPDGTVQEAEPEALHELDDPEAHFEAIHDGLVAVNEGSRGTARAVFEDFEISVAGKTGTAQAGGDRENTSWYVGYAPAEDPEHVVAVVIEEGGGGSETAAPLTRRVFEGLFDLELQELELGPETE